VSAIFLGNDAITPWLNSALELARAQLAEAIREIDAKQLDAVICVFDKRLRPSRNVVVAVALRRKLLELAASVTWESIPDPIRERLARPAAPGTYHCLAYRGDVNTPEDQPATDCEYGLLSGVPFVAGGTA
jgi:hypothetical protein